MSNTSLLDNNSRSLLERATIIVDHLQQSLRDLNEREKVLATQMEGHEMQLRSLAQQRSRLKEHVYTNLTALSDQLAIMDGLRATLSPVPHLPAEMLLRIFSFVIDDAALTLEADLAAWTCPVSAGREPFILASVCAQWRRIVNQNSSLWRPFLIRTSKLAPMLLERESQRIAYWMEMSPHSRQRVTILDWRQVYHTTLRELITTKLCQWDSITIVMVEAPLREWNAAKLRAKEVVIVRANPFSLVNFNPLLRFASKLVIYGMPPEWGDLPWVSLRSLTLKGYAHNTEITQIPFGKESFILLLRSAPRLTDLVLDFGVQLPAIVTNEVPVVTHLKLESLSFHLYHSVMNGSLFGVTLDTPSLRKVSLLTLELPEATDRDAFHCMWNYPKHLILPPLSDYQVVNAAELIRWYPLVDTLEVDGANIDTLFVFMHTLTSHTLSDPGPLPLPSLSSLLLTNTDVRGDTLVELLESRLQHARAGHENFCAITDISMYGSPAVLPSHWKRVNHLLQDARSKISSGGNAFFA